MTDLMQGEQTQARPRLRKPEEAFRPPHVPIFWERRGQKVHIGYTYPHSGKVYTTHGNISEDAKRSSDGRTTVTGNKMHLRRMMAAYASEDFTYRGE